MSNRFIKFLRRRGILGIAIDFLGNLFPFFQLFVRPFFFCNSFFLLSLEYRIFVFLPSTRVISICWHMEYFIFYPQQVFFIFLEYGIFQEYSKK